MKLYFALESTKRLSQGSTILLKLGLWKSIQRNVIEFPDYSVFQCVNEAYSDFITKLMGVIDNIAPIQKVWFYKGPA